MAKAYTIIAAGGDAAQDVGAGSIWDVEWDDDFMATAPKRSVALVTSGSYLYGAGVYGDKRWSFASITSAGAAGSGYGTNVDAQDGGRAPSYATAIRQGHSGVLILGLHASANSIFLGENANATNPTFGYLWNPVDGSWELHFWLRVGSDQDPSFSNPDAAIWGIAQSGSNPPRAFGAPGGFTDNPGFSFFCVFSDTERTYFNSTYSTSIPTDTNIYFVNFIRAGGVEVVDTGVEAYNSAGVGEAYWRRGVIRRKAATADTIFFQVYDEDGTDLSGELSSSFDESPFEVSSPVSNYQLVSPFISVNSAEIMIDRVRFMQRYAV